MNYFTLCTSICACIILCPFLEAAYVNLPEVEKAFWQSYQSNGEIKWQSEQVKTRVCNSECPSGFEFTSEALSTENVYLATKGTQIEVELLKCTYESRIPKRVNGWGNRDMPFTLMWFSMGPDDNIYKMRLASVDTNYESFAIFEKITID